MAADQWVPSSLRVATTVLLLVILRPTALIQSDLPEYISAARNECWVSKDIGGVPPFGHSTQLRVFVDPDLLQYDEVWAAAGTWNDNFGAAPADIVRVAGGVVTDLKRT